MVDDNMSVRVATPVPGFAQPSHLRAGWRQARRHLVGSFGLALFLLAVAAAWLGPSLRGYDPVATDTRHQLEGPSLSSPFGTDELGRDELGRVLSALRTSMIVGIGAASIATVFATLIGLVSGYFGGWIDSALQRVVDAMMSMPWLLVSIAVVALVGTGTVTVIVVIGGLMAFGSSRVIRSSCITVSRSNYIEASRSLGCGTLRIILRHVFPNAMTSLVIVASTSVGTAILTEAALSFLGFGIVPPAASLGNMLGIQGRRWMLIAPWLAIFPGIMLSLVVFSVNMIGDAVRDFMDPKQRSLS